MPRNDHLNHKPNEEGIKTIEELRRQIIALDEWIQKNVTPGHEKTQALLNLEVVRFWAVKGIVIVYPADELPE